MKILVRAKAGGFGAVPVLLVLKDGSAKLIGFDWVELDSKSLSAGWEQDQRIETISKPSEAKEE